MKTIFELSKPGRRAYTLPKLDVPEVPLDKMLPASVQREEDAALPEVSELDMVRHFMQLSRKNFSVDTHFYPLGSCTMKYNPKVNEVVSSLAEFTSAHPYLPAEMTQGLLKLLFEFEGMLQSITGLPAFSLQPAAGAHGELVGMMITRAYFDKKKEPQRKKILIPDSGHGTNPASAASHGFEIVELASNAQGRVDLEQLAAHLDETVAALMLTNPNTLGLFEKDIVAISDMLHKNGSLLYGDGANLNALLGVARPGDLGIDILHVNVHKTFSTPHGGGGPGAGPLGVTEDLAPFLPVPRIIRENNTYALSEDFSDSIGRVKAFFGNVGILIRAYCYIRCLGAPGLRQVSEQAIINANYLKAKLAPYFDIPYNDMCMHEFVLSCTRQNAFGVTALDVAKRLIDHGFHPPTIYFPLIVKEALMIEPTETESIETLDAFADALIAIAREAEENPDLLHEAPQSQCVGRLDEVTAARNPVLKWNKNNL